MRSLVDLDSPTHSVPHFTKLKLLRALNSCLMHISDAPLLKVVLLIAGNVLAGDPEAILVVDSARCTSLVGPPPQTPIHHSGCNMAVRISLASEPIFFLVL